MTDLTTSWLGLTLRSPLVIAASPISHDLVAAKQAVAAGAGAIVMYSLFEEQVVAEQMAAHHFLDSRIDNDAEARSFLPDSDVFALGTEPYLRQLEQLCQHLDVPVIASLNGNTPGGWTDYAKQLEARGAAAIELNLYDVVTSATRTAAEIESDQLGIVESVVNQVSVPVTVKLSPFYSALPAFAKQLKNAGARGVTLFNRFYQPDIDLEQLDVDLKLAYSTSAELPLRLHALAILHPSSALELACSGGVHSGLDAAKAILAGASVVQIASALLEHGPEQLATIHNELHQWLDDKQYRSVSEACGVMSLASAPAPQQWERLNYMKILQGWQPRKRK
ncbi:dihydroorotate dehydrogenase-like protein [Alcanivorax sp. 1008]|uniref:dihydroorotate dehydrogenase-like protein n=1 Tax=Alcanivorax sp. 1008 TaxID=2816853 RepID=UPI001D903902|nr:dihydroorotate dehydrogenase-like protein [Alcanivorax sp. 1008]MCC1495773.1 dihydroorotate dehydrogenase-like protein [Alcanivorax sp. 1008]